MSWLSVAILAYLLLAVVFLVDKHILTAKIPNPKVYTFYVGLLGLLIVALAPFVGFYWPPFSQIFLAFSAGVSIIFALFWLYKALQLFDSSRVVPAIGGTLPFFTFLLVFIISWGQEIPALFDFFAMILLIFGSVLISLEKSKKISLESLKISLMSAFFFALYFVLVKYVYMSTPFWTGQILIRIGSALAVLTFLLFSSELKREIFQIKMGLQKKTTGILLANQALGATANILQNWAVALAPLAYLAVVNALQGTQYVFLLGLAVILSVKFPQILKEEISREVIFQKIIAILLIGAGLVLLAYD